MKVAIVGSRGYSRLGDVSLFVTLLPHDAVIVSGGARGVDSAAESAARVRGMQTVIYKAEWARYGNSAGYKRNADIVKAADVVVAFWDGVSKGTKHTIDLAHQAEIPVLVIVNHEPEPEIQQIRTNASFDIGRGER